MKTIVDFDHYRRGKSQAAGESLEATIAKQQARILRTLADCTGADSSRVDEQAALIAKSIMRMMNPPLIKLNFSATLNGPDVREDLNVALEQFGRDVATHALNHSIAEFIAVAAHLCLALPLAQRP